MKILFNAIVIMTLISSITSCRVSKKTKKIKAQDQIDSLLLGGLEPSSEFYKTELKLEFSKEDILGLHNIHLSTGDKGTQIELVMIEEGSKMTLNAEILTAKESFVKDFESSIKHKKTEGSSYTLVGKAGIKLDIKENVFKSLVL
jgi:hypothetical protein